MAKQNGFVLIKFNIVENHRKYPFLIV